MTVNRTCSRPGCQRPAVATLEFNYADQLAIIGPLQPAGNPHRWDLCEDHVRRTTVPQGWRLVIKEQLNTGVVGDPLVEQAGDDDEAELLALADAVQGAYSEADGAPETPPARLVRREEIPIPTGHHPARRNLPSNRPRRHLRAVHETD